MRAGIVRAAFAAPIALVAACFSNTGDDTNAPPGFFFDDAGFGFDATTADASAPLDAAHPDTSPPQDAAPHDASPADTTADSPNDGPSDAPDDADAHDDGGSDADAQALTYPGAVLADTPLAYWRFGESSGTVAADHTGTTNGTYVGGVTLGAAGAIAHDSDTAATFDGTTAYVAMGSGFNFGASSPMSIEAWIKPPAADSTYRRVLSKENNDANGREGYLIAWEGQNSLSFERWASGAGTAVVATLAPGVYSHVVGVFDGTTLSIYVNGALVSTNASPQSLVTFSTALDVATFGPDADTESFQGTIDELAIYAHALTPQAILVHYQVGSGT